MLPINGVTEVVARLASPGVIEYWTRKRTRQRDLKSDTTFFMEADLIGNRMGYLVRLCWRFLDHCREWKPDECINEDEIEFWWGELPITEILADEKKIHENIFKANDFNFIVETKIGVWPHLTLLVVTNDKLNQDEFVEYQNYFAIAQEEWNKKNRGIIHSVGELLSVNDKSFQINIDFGSALKAGLQYVLNHLDDVKKTIKSIKIYSGNL